MDWIYLGYLTRFGLGGVGCFIIFILIEKYYGKKYGKLVFGAIFCIVLGTAMWPGYNEQTHGHVIEELERERYLALKLKWNETYPRAIKCMKSEADILEFMDNAELIRKMRYAIEVQTPLVSFTSPIFFKDTLDPSTSIPDCIMLKTGFVKPHQFSLQYVPVTHDIMFLCNLKIFGKSKEITKVPYTSNLCLTNDRNQRMPMNDFITIEAQMPLIGKNGELLYRNERSKNSVLTVNMPLTLSLAYSAQMHVLYRDAVKEDKPPCSYRG